MAVSNYHVFKGTAIGAEQIKLVGSDKAYKVASVVKSDEQEDFILFLLMLIMFLIFPWLKKNQVLAIGYMQ